VKGRRRHILVDTLGMLLGVVVTGANVGDRGGARLLLAQVVERHPRLRKVSADQGYTGPELAEFAKLFGDRVVEIVRRNPEQKGFEVLPKRWIVERTFAWLVRCRRLAKDLEYTVSSARAQVHVAMIRLMLARLAP